MAREQLCREGSEVVVVRDSAWEGDADAFSLEYSVDMWEWFKAVQERFKLDMKKDFLTESVVKH